MPTFLLSNPDMVHYALLPHAGRLWESFFSSLELVVVEFRRPSRPRLIVERGFEAALFESVQPVVDRLAIPAVFVLDLVGREAFQIFPGSSEAFDRLRISLVRELLADSTFREIGYFGPFFRHTGCCLCRVSKVPTDSITAAVASSRDAG